MGIHYSFKVKIIFKIRMFNIYNLIIDGRMIDMSTIIIGTVVIGSMIYVAFRQIKSARKGESSCGCGCSGCSKSKSCHGIKIEK